MNVFAGIGFCAATGRRKRPLHDAGGGVDPRWFSCAEKGRGPPMAIIRIRKKERKIKNILIPYQKRPKSNI